MVTITIEEQGRRPQRMTFSGSRVDIGRADDNDVVLPARNISKYHARLLRRGRDIVITDLGSTNGTVVNGRRISAPQILEPHDSLSIGFFRLTLEWAPREVESIEASGAISPPSGLVRSSETVPNHRKSEGSPTLDRLPALDSDGEIVDNSLDGTSSEDLALSSSEEVVSAAWPRLPELLERFTEFDLHVLLVAPPRTSEQRILAWSGRHSAADRDRAEGEAHRDGKGLHFVAPGDRLRSVLLERAAGVAGDVLVLRARSAAQGLLRLQLLATASLEQQVPVTPLHMSAMLDFVVRVGEDQHGDPVVREVSVLHASAPDPSGLINLSLVDAARLDSLPRSFRDILADLLQARANTVPHPISVTRP